MIWLVIIGGLVVLRWVLQPLFAQRGTVLTADGPPVELSVVIPAYNEAKRLPKMLRDTYEFLKTRRSYEILVIDDGSRDDTARVAEDFGWSQLRVARLPKNRGKGGAVRAGAMLARGQYILVVDADGATRISDLERLEQAAKTVDPVVVVGSRAHLVSTDAVAKRSPLRNFLMRGFHFVVSVIGGIEGVRDTQCGFKLVSRSALGVLTGLHLERWAFDVELLYIAAKLRYTILEVDVNWTEVTGSKLNILKDSVQMARDIACLRLAYFLGLWRLPSS